MNKKIIRIAGSLLLLVSTCALADVHNSDVTIYDSLCVGFDCANPENYGFDTIRLKENNLRIHFEDTSTGTFPGNDWRILVNDTANGGVNKFSVEDVNAARLPLTIEAGARSNSLYVESDGDVGLGTANPAVDLHVVTGDSPTVRLEQDGSSGFTAQTWDMAGNETNFFIRDVSNGSKLPFRIRPNAPTSSLDIAGTGNVGLGTASPTAALEVKRSNGEAKVFVNESSGVTAKRTLLELSNQGSIVLQMNDTTRPQSWEFTTGYHFKINNSDNPFDEFYIDPVGNANLLGILTENSDVNSKQEIVPVDRHNVLSKIAELEIAEWSYIDTPNERHVGPMAQDFYSAFGLGHSEKLIATLDTSGVALAGIQALVEENDLLQKENRALLEELDKQAARLDQLETQQYMMQSVLTKLYDSEAAGAVSTAMK